MDKSKNAFFGSILLVTGCCIGAGMLGLPMDILTLGFVPSLFPLFFAWVYMNMSGVMLVELYAGVKEDINLMGLMEKTLGKVFKGITFILFAFLFYSILTAYINGSSIIIHDFIAKLGLDLPFWFVVIGNTLLLFLGILFGTGEVDVINRVFVGGMFLTYFTLIALGIFNLNSDNLATMQWSKQVVFSIPLFLVSFGYQNLIPTLSNYLDRDKRKVILSFVIGTGIALGVYLIWNFITLGLAPEGASTTGSSADFLTRIFAQSPGMILFLISIFSLFAIVTSLLTISTSFVDFLGDRTQKQSNRFFYCVCVLLPPLVFALFNPHIFLTALTYGAGFSAICLFGILPTLALWKSRYGSKPIQTEKILPGGKALLAVYLIVSVSIILFKLFQ